MNVSQLEKMTVAELIEFVTVGDRPQKKESQPVEIVKSNLTSGYWELFEDGKMIGFISSVTAPGTINSYGAGYEVWIRREINGEIEKELCFTGSLRMAKAYAKSKLWK